jgi:hypothetical protein
MSIISNAVTIADAGAFSVSLGSLVHIKTLTASSSATLSFVHGTDGVVLDSTYPIYKFEFISCHPATDGTWLGFQGSTDGGGAYGLAITSSAFSSYQRETGSSSGIQYEGSVDLAQSTSFQRFNWETGNDNDQTLSGSFTLYNPSSTTFVKHFISKSNNYHPDFWSNLEQVGGYFNTTSAINAIRFQMESGNIDAGKIKLYGIKDS